MEFNHLHRITSTSSIFHGRRAVHSVKRKLSELASVAQNNGMLELCHSIEEMASKGYISAEKRPNPKARKRRKTS